MEFDFDWAISMRMVPELASEIQDLLKMFQTLLEDLDDVAGIKQIAVAGIEEPFEVASSLRGWLATAKARVEEIRILEDKKKKSRKAKICDIHTF